MLVPVRDGINLFVFEGNERTYTAAPLDLANGALGEEVRRAFLTRYDYGTVTLSVEGVEAVSSSSRSTSSWRRSP